MSFRVLGLAVIALLVTAASLAGNSTVFARHVGSRLGAAPSSAQIEARLSHTKEIGSRGAYFRAMGKPLTIKDGRGTGTLTAVVGARYPTANDLGQVIFFWHNSTFMSVSSSYETLAVKKLSSSAPGTFVVVYARYKHGDSTCCPSLKPRTVHYGWSGHKLISNGVPPKGAGSPVRIQYQP